MNENFLIPYDGGMVEMAKASRFPSKDRTTGQMVEDPEHPGQPMMIDLPDRIVITYGKRKATLSGNMVKAIARTYLKNEEFKAWCEQCK